MEHRDIREMTVMWRHYRYLRSNPALLPGMARVQEYVSDLPVYQIPKQKVPAIEGYLRDGDIIAITSRDTGGLHLARRAGLPRPGRRAALPARLV